MTPTCAATTAPGRTHSPAPSCASCGAPAARTPSSCSTRSTSSAPPAAVLLEVLDPEQNDRFRDAFVELPFDLSEVLFLTTANETDQIPPALRDRLEIIDLPGYSEAEKVAIAESHLVAAQNRASACARWPKPRPRTGFWELMRIARWHVEGEAYARALSMVVEAQAALPMALSGARGGPPPATASSSRPPAGKKPSTWSTPGTGPNPASRRTRTLCLAPVTIKLFPYLDVVLI